LELLQRNIPLRVSFDIEQNEKQAVGVSSGNRFLEAGRANNFDSQLGQKCKAAAWWPSTK